MRYYSRCKFCHSDLPAARPTRTAFCDYKCKNGYRDYRREKSTGKGYKKILNMAAVRSRNGTMWIQEPLWNDDEEMPSATS